MSRLVLHSVRRLIQVRDDLAYLLPMAMFLGFNGINQYWPGHYAVLYTAEALSVAAALILFWPYYTKISWRYWWLGVLLGVVGVVQWVGMQFWLEKHWALFRPSGEAFNPMNHFASSSMRDAFIALRWASASLLVPVMEELFWRDFAWRTILAPNDFKLAGVGEWGWTPLVAVALLFAAPHGNWWASAIVWGLMIGLLLAWTRSLGACIIMHGVTNFLLGLYVLYYHAWSLW